MTVKKNKQKNQYIKTKKREVAISTSDNNWTQAEPAQKAVSTEKNRHRTKTK